MNDRGKLILALVVLALLVGCGALSCVGLGAIVASTPEYDVSAEVAARDGNADGRAGTADLCVQRAYERAEPCGTFGPDCQNIAREYLLSCLRALPEPPADLCVGAPAPSLLPDPAYSASICGPRGWPVEGAACDTVVATLETHCAVEGQSAAPE